MAKQVMSRRQMMAESGAALAALAVVRLPLSPGGHRKSKAHGPTTMDLTVQNPDGGLASIVDLRITNGTVDVPAFVPGTRDPVVLTARKTDARKPTSWSFVTIDTNGRRTSWS